MPEQSNNPFRFWQELKRRKVVRVVTVYVAAAFVIIEVTNNISDSLDLPEWIAKWIIILLGLGLLITIILSWIFDITPEGIEKTKPVKEIQTVGKAVPSNYWKVATYISLAIILLLLSYNIVTGIYRNRSFLKLEKSIAVLPFKNFSADISQEYMCDGLTDEIINHLYRIISFDKVVSLNSVLTYKGTSKRIPEIANELNVNYILEGTYKKIGDQVRVTAQLIDPKSDKHIWQNEYDQPYEEVVAIQIDIARLIANELRIELSQEEVVQMEKEPTENPEAFNYYLQGRYFFTQSEVSGFWKASEYFQKAIDADTHFAKAYVSLADCYALLYYHDEIPKSETTSKVYHLLDKALQLDKQLAEAYQSLAACKFWWEFDWQGAEKGFKHALDLNPNLVGNNEYAWYLAVMRRFDEAIAEAQRTLRLDPFSFLTHQTLVHVYSVAGRNNEAIEQCQKMLELGLNDASTYNKIASVYWRMGNYDKAIKAYQKSMALYGSTSESIDSLGQAYQESGIRGYWSWNLEQINGHYHKQPLMTAKYYAQLGEKEKALTYLEIAYQNRDPDLVWLNSEPEWDSLRNESRFQDIFDRMNFPD